MKESLVKRHMSVLMMFVRSTIYKVLLLLIGMAVVETGLFYWKLREATAPLATGGAQLWALEQILEESHISWVFGAAFIGITVLLCMVGCERGSKVGYTFRRLQISERFVFLWQAVYHVCCYLILLAVQILLAWAFSIWYTHAAEPAAVSVQTIFLAFYRNDFLHGLLPLSDGIGWMRNIALLLGLGIASAVFPFRQRRGSFGGEIVFFGIFVLICFERGLGDVGRMLLVIVVFLLACGTAVCYWLTSESEDEAEEARSDEG